MVHLPLARAASDRRQQSKVAKVLATVESALLYGGEAEGRAVEARSMRSRRRERARQMIVVVVAEAAVGSACRVARDQLVTATPGIPAPSGISRAVAVGPGHERVSARRDAVRRTTST